MANTTFHKVSPCSNSHHVPVLFSACRASPSLQVLCLLSQELHCLFIKKPQLEIEELLLVFFFPQSRLSLSYISSLLSCCLSCFVASSFCYCWELFIQPALPVMKGDTDGRDRPSQPSHLSLWQLKPCAGGGTKACLLACPAILTGRLVWGHLGWKFGGVTEKAKQAISATIQPPRLTEVEPSPIHYYSSHPHCTWQVWHIWESNR